MDEFADLEAEILKEFEAEESRKNGGHQTTTADGTDEVKTVFVKLPTTRIIVANLGENNSQNFISKS